MHTPSDRLKNSAASTRRTASTVRSIANQQDLSLADQGVLLTAAAILDAIGNRVARSAKTTKEAEEKFASAEKAALTKIKPAINALPMTTTLDKVVLVGLGAYHTESLARSLRTAKGADETAWALNYYVGNVQDEVARGLAYDVAKGRLTVDTAIDRLKARHQALQTNDATIDLAKRIDAALATQLDQAA